ncbi:MAG: NAD(P)H-hydrate dehydratase [Saprospiraceae bacterium]
MKIFNTEQVKKWDEETIQSKGIRSIDLMESAANAFSKKFSQKYPLSSLLYVFCGTGNNGGDGLAIARILSMQGYDVKVWLADWGQKKAPDFTTNLNQLPAFGHVPLEVINMKEPPMLEPNSIIIDALFGTGLNRPLDGDFEDLIHWINSLHNKIIAVDIPSGMFADRHTDTAIHANHTITFQSPKLSFLLPSYEKFTGKVDIVDIGLIPQFISKTKTPYYLTEPNLIKGMVSKRKKFDHKGVYGHALLINGSYGKAGAAILSAKACLRSGVGLLTNHIPSQLNLILQMTVPEAMASIDEHDFYWSSLPENIRRFTAIGVGCGINQKESTERVFQSLFEEYDGKMIIDADGINILSKHQALLSKIPVGSILTPHVKEFERLFGKTNTCFDRLQLLQEKAKLYSVTIILKGANSQIAFSDGTVYFNCTGNPGMATAGSGDVLTGILTALVAQGYDSQSAALIGTYVHGLAGDIAYQNSSYESLIASDVIDHLGKAFHTLFN